MEKYSLNIKQLLYVIIVYPFFKTYYFSEMGIMPYVNQVLFALAFVVIALFYIVKLPHINLNSGIRFIIFYYIIILVSTILSGTLTPDYLSLISFSIGFGLLVNYSLQNKKDFLYFLRAIYFLLYVYIVANLIAMFMYPSGIPSITSDFKFPQYVFGNTNSVIKVVLPGLCFAFLYDLLKVKKIRTKSWILLALVWITLVNTWSVTSMLGLFVFTFILLKKVGKKHLFFDYFSILVLSIGLSIFIIFLRYEENILTNIVGLFGKDLTFTNRDILWENTVNSIKSSPLFGHGVQNFEGIWRYTGNTFGSHNYYLDTLLRGGIVALVVFIFGLIYFGRKIIYYKNNYVMRTLIGTSCAYFVILISEPMISTEYLMFSIFFVLISRVDIIIAYYNDD